MEWGTACVCNHKEPNGFIGNTCKDSFFSRTLSEFWHWFVANIPGDSVDDGEVVFDLLFPLVLPEGDGDHRYRKFGKKIPFLL